MDDNDAMIYVQPISFHEKIIHVKQSCLQMQRIFVISYMCFLSHNHSEVGFTDKGINLLLIVFERSPQ